MVSEKVINDTVKRMLVSNIDSDTIISTLKDIGIDDAKAREIINNLKNSANSDGGSQEGIEQEQAKGVVRDVSPKEELTNGSISKMDSEKLASEQKIQAMQNELQTQGEKTELHETLTHNLLNEHAQKLEEVGKKVEEVHKVVSSPSRDASIQIRLSELEQRTGDISAQTKALASVLKDILETDRKILTELKSKEK